MRKKLLALFTAFLLVCSLGVVGLTVNAAELTVTQVNTDNNGFGTAIYVEINSNAYNCGKYGVDDGGAPYDTTYISLTDSNGTPKTVTAECWGTQVCINRNGNIAVGDILTIKAGFTWGSYVASHDQVFNYTASGSPWGTGTGSGGGATQSGTASIAQVNHCPLTASPNWGQPALIVRFDLPAGNGFATGTNYPASLSGITYTNAYGESKPLSTMHYAGDGNFIIHMAQNTSGTGAYNAMIGDKLSFASSYTVSDGTTAYSIGGAKTYIVHVLNDLGFDLKVYNSTTDDATSIAVSAGKTSLQVGATTQITCTPTPATALCTPKYVSSSPSVATVNASGKITAVSAGTTTITATCGSVSRTISITVVQAGESTFCVKKLYSTYQVPMAVAKLGKTFSLLGQYPDLKYYYDFGDTVSEEKAVTESMIDASTINYNVAGEYNVKIKDPNSTKFDTIKVRVYQLIEAKVFDTLGASGYDGNDTLSRNESGTWNGHWIAQMSSFSTNVLNCRSGEWDNDPHTRVSSSVIKATRDMSNYIEYKVAKAYNGNGYNVPAGTIFSNSAGNNSSINLWLLEQNVLLYIRPAGASVAIGFGSPSRWNNTQSSPINPPSGVPYFPMYSLGDTITFKAGMPIYKCTVESGDGPEAIDHMWIEGMFMEDFTYKCTQDDRTNNKFEFSKDATGFTLPTSMNVGKGAKALIEAVRTPVGATTGTFSYAVADSSVATVSSLGYVTGVKIGGETTVTVTFNLGDGSDPIVKTITVRVTNSVTKVESTVFRIQQGNESPDLSLYEITVHYADGTSAKVKLNDTRVTINTKFRPTTVGKTLTIMGKYTEYDVETTLRLKFEVVEGAVNEDNADTGESTGGGSTGGGGNTGGGSTGGGSTSGDTTVGCGGAIGVSSFAGLALLGLGYALVKRKRRS